MANDGDGDDDLSIVERLQKQEEMQLVASANAKLRARQKPTGPELKALAKHEKLITEKYGGRLLRAAPKAFVLELLGTSSKVVTDNRKRRGFPWPEGRNSPVDLGKLLRWFWAFYLEHSGEPPRGASEEDVLLYGASQELKDEFLRERIVERRYSNEQRRLELQREIDQHVPIDVVETLLSGLAAAIRKKREDTTRNLSPRDAEKVGEAFEDLADDFLRTVKDCLGSGGEDTDGV